MTCPVCGFDWEGYALCVECVYREAMRETRRESLRSWLDRPPPSRVDPSDDPHSPEFYAVGQTGVELMPAPEVDWLRWLHDDVK